MSIALGAADHVNIDSQSFEDLEPEFSLITGSLKSTGITTDSTDGASQAVVKRDPMKIATIQSTGG